MIELSSEIERVMSTNIEALCSIVRWSESIGKGSLLEIATKCAICGTFGYSETVFPASIDSSTFSYDVFSARRLPDRRHYQWVKCKECSLYRSDPIWDIDLTDLYTNSTFDYSKELHGLKTSYRRIVSKSCPEPQGKSILEIGGGNGFFLEEALQMGFARITEIEPSVPAFESASDRVKPFFKVDVVRQGLIDDNSEDLVVIFHVLDHLPDPLAVLKLINQMLKPGGAICIAVHNVNSISSKLLKNRSPIFDVEHTYLYSKKTILRLLEQAGFESVRVKHYKNSYSLAYLLHLVPISRNVRKRILSSTFGDWLSKVRVTVPLGNMWATAVK